MTIANQAKLRKHLQIGRQRDQSQNQGSPDAPFGMGTVDDDREPQKGKWKGKGQEQERTLTCTREPAPAAASDGGESQPRGSTRWPLPSAPPLSPRDKTTRATPPGTSRPERGAGGGAEEDTASAHPTAGTAVPKTARGVAPSDGVDPAYPTRQPPPRHPPSPPRGGKKRPSSPAGEGSERRPTWWRGR